MRSRKRWEALNSSPASLFRGAVDEFPLTLQSAYERGPDEERSTPDANKKSPMPLARDHGDDCGNLRMGETDPYEMKEYKRPSTTDVKHEQLSLPLLAHLLDSASTFSYPCQA